MSGAIEACIRDRLEIFSKYKISSIEEFENKVNGGSIPEHPGWEDLIIVENLENTISKLKTKKDSEDKERKKYLSISSFVSLSLS